MDSAALLLLELTTALLVWSNPNQSNRRSANQWYFQPMVSVLGMHNRGNDSCLFRTRNYKALSSLQWNKFLAKKFSAFIPCSRFGENWTTWTGLSWHFTLTTVIEANKTDTSRSLPIVNKSCQGLEQFLLFGLFETNKNLVLKDFRWGGVLLLKIN